MAKLTISFKGRPIAIHHLDEQPVTIGRNADCSIHIDSLAIAPRHAELLPTGTGHLMLALDHDFPVLVNRNPVERALLQPGDLIQVGKHDIDFSEDECEVIISTPEPTQDSSEERPSEEEDPVPAYIQVQSGADIGKVILLRRAVTRLHHLGMHDLAVTRENNTYSLVRLNPDLLVKIDGKPMMEEEAPLGDKTRIETESTRFGFFIGEGGDIGAMDV